MLLFCLFACFPGKDGAADSEPAEAAETGEEDQTEHTACEDADGDCYGPNEDCDNADPTIHPGATEACDGLDNDCNGDIDEGVAGTYYPDDDGDGFGNLAQMEYACDRPEAFVDNGADCDDENPDVHPNAEEVGNGEDDDCDGEIDEGVSTVATLDSFTVTWSSGGATVSVVGSASAWSFGMAETRAGAAGWYGESCFVGSEPWGYDDYGYDVCHPLGATGGTLKTVRSPDDVAEGFTLFTNTIADAASITYILVAEDGSACWVYGDDVSYYDDFGCTEA